MPFMYNVIDSQKFIINDKNGFVLTIGNKKEMKCMYMICIYLKSVFVFLQFI